MAELHVDGGELAVHLSGVEKLDTVRKVQFAAHGWHFRH